jgi:hypothetical protein
MKITKKTVIGVIIVFLWTVGLFLLTYVVLFANDRVAKKNDIDLTRLNNSVIFNVDKIIFSQNLFRDVTASGWAFIEHDGQNPNKRLHLILASEMESYIFEMGTHDRFDLNVIPILSKYTVPKYRNGFEGTFSPLMMKNGVYKLYIFIQENENIEGITDTGIVFTKYYGSFTEYLGGEEIPKVNEVLNTNITLKFDFLCDIENNKAMISGWAFIEDGASKNVPSRPIIKLIKPNGKTSFYSTASVRRVDVAQAFNANELLMSGFSSEIPTESLGMGDNIFSIIFDGLCESNYTCTVSW